MRCESLFGLVGWGYIKIIINLTAVVYNAVNVSREFGHSTTLAPILATVYFTTDLIFHIILIVGAHQKNPRKIQICYRYSIAAFQINAMLSLALLGIHVVSILKLAGNTPILFILMVTLHIVMAFIGIILLNLGVSQYLIFLSREELFKLENIMQFQLTTGDRNNKVNINNCNKNQLNAVADRESSDEMTKISASTRNIQNKSLKHIDCAFEEDIEIHDLN